MENEPSVGYLVWRLSTKWRAANDRALAPLGLTHAQFALLAPLSAMSWRPSQRELADHTGLETIYVSKLARALEQAGLIDRPADPDDPRAVRLSLTDRGREIVAAAIAEIGGQLAERTAVLGAARTRDLRATLLTLLNGSEPPMTTPVRDISGRDINLAAAAARSILDTLIERAGLTFEQYVALRALDGAPADPDTVARTAAGQVADVAAVRRAVDELVAAGLARGTGVIEPTERGSELFRRILADSTSAGDRLFEGIDAADLSVARRVLAQVTARAAEVRAGL